jgi:AraC-like DNA-binding protein
MLTSTEIGVLGETEHRLGLERTVPASGVRSAGPHGGASGGPGPSYWHWSTEEIPPRDRVSHWHDVHAQAIARRAITVEVEEFGDVDVHLWRLGAPGHQVSVQRMRIGSPSVATRGPSMLGDGSDDVILHLQLSGPRLLRQFGREAAVPTGGAVFSWNAEASTIVLPQATEFFSIALPHRSLRALAPGVEDRLGRFVPPDHAVLGLLRRYLGLIDSDAASNDPVVGRAMGLHILDLAAHLTQAADGARGPGASSGLRAARLHALKQDIQDNLAGDVSARALAQRHRVSPRYVHKLFETEGSSVSRYVLGLRLEAAGRKLGDPELRGRTIAEIAYAVGFGDIATFNRAFRERFGMTPGDARRHAKEMASGRLR